MPGTRKHIRKWAPKFFAELKACGNVSAACRAAGVDRRTVYNHKEASAEFAAKWEDAMQEAADILEGEAWSRAMAGSDLLIIFLLKGLRPNIYRERVTLPPHELDQLIEQTLANRAQLEGRTINTTLALPPCKPSNGEA